MKHRLFPFASAAEPRFAAETVLTPRPERIRSLRTSMTRSFIGATALLVGFLEVMLLLGLVVLVSFVILPFVSTLQVQRSAEHYALAVMLHIQEGQIDPQITFRPGLPGTLTFPGGPGSTDIATIPYTSRDTVESPPLYALLIAKDATIQASSAPASYPPHVAVADVLPARENQVLQALEGNEVSAVMAIEGKGQVVFALAPVWDQQGHCIGALYVQKQLPTVLDLLTGSPAFARLLLLLILGGLLLIPPVGGLFGMLTTRGLVQRIRRLETMTARVADGDYTQRIAGHSRDELGQLEWHFNRMGYQLALGLERQRMHTEQQARQLERSRISRDLHDNIKQQVFALAAQIATALTLLGNDASPLRTHLEIASELAYQARQELTSFIQGVRPLSPAPAQDFAQILSDLCATWQRHSGIAVDLRLHSLPPLQAHAQEQLQCLLQEALSNVARHSQASRVEVTLESRSGELSLTVADNGRGFHTSAVGSQSIGLHSMRERMAELGGYLTIESRPDQGTCLRASCPLAAWTASTENKEE